MMLAIARLAPHAAFAAFFDLFAYWIKQAEHGG